MKRAAFPLIVTLLHSAPALAQCDAGPSEDDLGVLRDTFPADLGEKPVQVTLKGGGNERIERKEVKASGTGVIEVTFDIPAEVPGGKVIFAGLVGKSIKDALQQIQTKPTPVK